MIDEVNSVVNSLENEITRLKTLKSYIRNEESQILNNFYEEVRSGNFGFSYGGNQALIDINKGNYYFNLLLDEIQNTIKTIEKILEEIFPEKPVTETPVTARILNHIQQLIIESNNIFTDFYGNYSLLSSMMGLKKLSKYGGIVSLAPFSRIDSNIIILGANGSGKTSFSQQFKDNDNNLVTLIPAHKILFNLSENNTRVLTQLQMKHELLRYTHNDIEMDSYNFIEEMKNKFSSLISTMENSNHKYLLESQKEGEIKAGENSVYETARRIFSTVFPDVSFELTGDSSTRVVGIKNKKTYNFNLLSDGEKAGIYYILSVLFCQNEGIIIIDEPETYLNPSIVKLLWDQLIAERSDCQFIFITHSVEFVMSRGESTIAWIKKFTYPSDWDIDFLASDSSLPRELLTTILGSKKDLLFCEGDKLKSHDYQIYSSLFGHKYNIIPKGGHTSVVNAVKAIKDSEELTVDVFGIIDGDNFDPSDVSYFEENNIYVLPFNEIEMLLFCDEVMLSTLSYQFREPDIVNHKIAKFKEEFWKKANSSMDKIRDSIVKNKIDNILNLTRIHPKNKDEINASVKTLIEKLDVDKIYSLADSEISTIFEGKEYDNLLKISNLKNIISVTLANNLFEFGYVKMAILQIQHDKDLQKSLINQYFNNFRNLI